MTVRWIVRVTTEHRIIMIDGKRLQDTTCVVHDRVSLSVLQPPGCAEGGRQVLVCSKRITNVT